MQRIADMVASHPAAPDSDREALVACIKACLECQHTCTACADACLHEKDPSKLVFCIRTDLDCADVCFATGRILSRASKPDAQTVKAILTACAISCDACAAECRQHAKMHEHCRICAEACEVCAAACRRLVEATPA